MKPIDFPERNVVYGEGQPEYIPLPACRFPEGRVVTCWQLTAEEIATVMRTGRLWLTQLTFHTPLQPIMPQAERPFLDRDLTRPGGDLSGG